MNLVYSTKLLKSEINYTMVKVIQMVFNFTVLLSGFKERR